ncbi:MULTISPECIES: hypothetical protein [unclassified Leptolyngbya]|uniref:hypothetical protein n=1 Tax=unclassified Leptolyngbya TaxID=2650499 RepID=UPI00168A1DBA|nr:MULTISPECIES: hypothetical protein [unclassified Leptolyngbya]MBD1909266.1 hypothetical protein [Leptolyngbya sp. FACHB-8]MBD2153496.1 hypothetical protein [Leptolyngbya sp. FACHB-16]
MSIGLWRSLPPWLTWIVPYCTFTLSIEAPLHRVLGNLQTLTMTGIRQGERGTLAGYEYKVRSQAKGIRILGPYGNRRWTLVTHVTILPNLEDERYTRLALTSRIARQIWIQLGIGVIAFVGLSIFIFRDTGNWAQIAATSFLQIGAIAYVLSLISLRLETNTLVKQLKQRLEAN